MRPRLAILALAVLALVGADVAADGLAARMDVVVADAVREVDPGTRAIVLETLSVPGDLVVVVGLIGLVAFELRGRPNLATHAVVIGVAAPLLVVVLKQLIARPRPDGSDLLSFPSGHADASLLAWGLFALAPLLLGKRASRARTVVAAIMVLTTAVGRVAGGVHYPTDILAGWSIATLALATLPASLSGQARSPRVLRVIGFTGMPGSGKSEAMEVAKARGLPVVRMGDLIWEEVERQGLPRDPANVGRVADLMRKEHGKDIWARRTLARIEERMDSSLVLVDGIRNIEEVEVFRARLGDGFSLVGIHSDRAERFRRMLERGRADDAKEPALLAQRDEREMGWGLARTIALADTMLVNDGTLETFKERVANLLDRIAEGTEPT